MKVFNGFFPLSHIAPTALLFLLSVVYSFAQDTSTVSSDNAIEQRLEKIGGATENEIDYTNLLDHLNYYREHKLNLNSASKEDLMQLELLDELKVNNLLEHIQKNGKLLTIYELQSVNGFDLETIFTILPFVTVSSAPVTEGIIWKDVFSKGNSMLMSRYQRILQTSVGNSAPDSTYPARLNSRYLGSPDKVYARYKFAYKNNISFGITTEKDAGEPLFPGKPNTSTVNGAIQDSLMKHYNLYKRGFDFYSAHFFMKTSGWLRALAIGDYEVKYGQGLTMWSGLSYSKTADVMNVRKIGMGINPYSSVNENVFMRGTAAAFGYKRLQADVFYSTQKIDGNISLTDTSSDQVLAVSSFETTGYHRTPSELDDRHSVKVDVIGSHLSYNARRLNVGFTGVKSMYGSALVKASSPYNSFDFTGKGNSNVGVDYSFFIKNMNFFGEAARSESGGIAYLNGLLVSLDANLSFSVLNRSYDKEYQSLFAKGFGEASKTSNEKGTYFGINAKPARAFTFTAYYDVFSFPWLKFQVNAPSAGYDYLTQLTYTPSKRTEIYFRHTEQIKMENVPSSAGERISTLVPVKTEHTRFNVNYSVSAAVSFGNRIEFVTYHKDGIAKTNGFMIYQDVDYKFHRLPVSLSFRYALFDTDDYNTLIYAKESDVLYAYSITSYYYRGSRTYLTLHYRVSRSLDLWFRYAQSALTNKLTQGSGNDLIDGKLKSEVKAQLRFQF